MVDLKTLATQLSEQGKPITDGITSQLSFEVHPIPGEIEVLQILVEGREELPIYISATKEQILCIAYLFTEDEVKSDMCADLNTAMLTASIAVPLSSFALVEDQYVLYGALAVSSSLDDIIHEILVLSSNVIDAIEVMSDYLN